MEVLTVLWAGSLFVGLSCWSGAAGVRARSRTVWAGLEPPPGRGAVNRLRGTKAPLGQNLTSSQKLKLKLKLKLASGGKTLRI